MLKRFYLLMLCSLSSVCFAQTEQSSINEEPTGLVTSSAISKQKQQAIFELLDIQNSADQMKQSMMAYGADMPADQKQFIEKMVSKIDKERLYELFIPIYDKHYTIDEIKELTAFYQSDLGQTMLTKLPLILQESMSIGQLYGKELAEQVLEEEMNKVEEEE